MRNLRNSSEGYDDFYSQLKKLYTFRPMVQLSSYCFLAVLNGLASDEPMPGLGTMPAPLAARYKAFVAQVKAIRGHSLDEQARLVLDEILALRVETMKWFLQHASLEAVTQASVSKVRRLKSDLLGSPLQDKLKRSSHILDGVMGALIAQEREPFNAAETTAPAKGNVSDTDEREEPTLFGFLKTSVACEYSIIVAELHRAGMLDRSPDGLADFMYDSTQRYGAYSLLLGLWQPANDLSDNEALGCQILAEIMRVERDADTLIKLPGLPN